MPVKTVGGSLSLDRGDGTVAPLKSSEVGSSITISGTLDGFGRAMRFSRYGVTQNPLVYAALSAARTVTLAAYVGIAGAIDAAFMFLGLTRQTTFHTLPPVGDFECQDYSAEYARMKFFYYLAPRTVVARLEVFIDIVLRYGIPCDIDTLDFGPDDGGIPYGGINETGRFGVLDFLRDFLKPIGRRFFFRADGYIDVFRMDPNADPVKVFTAGDILRMDVTPPAVNAPNSVTVTADCYPYVGPPGARSVTVEEYGPIVTYEYDLFFVNKQDSATGVIAPVSPVPTAGILTVTDYLWKKRTKTNYAADGGTIVSQLIEEYEQYSPLACRNEQNGAGVVTWNHSFDVYSSNYHGDSEWHVDPVPSLRVIRRTFVQHTYDAGTKRRLTTSTEVSRLSKIDMPVASVDAAGVETPSAGFLTTDGQSWWGGREFIDVDDAANGGTLYGAGVWNDVEVYSTAYEVRARPSGVAQMLTETFTPNADGELTSDVIQLYLWGKKTYVYFGGAAPVPPTLSWKFKATNATFPGLVYCTLGVSVGAFQWNGLFNTSTVNRARYDDHTFLQYATVVLLQSTYEYYERMRSLYFVSDADPDRREDLDLSFFGHYPLPIPINDYEVTVKAPAPKSATAPDQVRIGLSGVVTEEFLANEQCETEEECHVVAFDRLREVSAAVVDLEAIMDLETEEGSVIEVPPIPDLNGARSLVVWSIDRQINSNGDCRNVIKALYIPEHLRVAV